MNRTKRWVATLVAASVSYAGMLQSAQAGLVGTDQVAEAQGVVSADARAAEQRARVLSLLDRADVAAGLQEHGLSADQARERVAALTDAEVEQLSQTIDTAPAGANSFLGVLVFIFVLLLVTDILGLTKVFPFTRSVR
jgi:hypothetical protein